MKKIVLDEIELLKLLLMKSPSEDDIQSIVNAYDSNAITEDGRPILNYAIIHENIQMVELLLKNGSDIRFCEKCSGYSALHFAVQKNNMKISQMLIDAGAEIDCVDINGNTPLWRAIFDCVDENIILMLLENGANPNKKNLHRVSPKSLVDEAQTKVSQWIKSKRQKRIVKDLSRPE